MTPMKMLVAAALFLCCSLTPALAKSGNTDVALTNQNRAIITRFADLFYTQHKVRDAFNEYVAEDYIQHNPMATDGRDAGIEALEPFFASQPDLRHEVLRIIVDGNLAAVHVRGTNGPDDRGTAVVDIFRLENGKIVEHWDVIQEVPAESANPHPMF